MSGFFPPPQDIDSLGCRGNVLLDRAVGSKLIILYLSSDEALYPMESLSKKAEAYKRKLE